MIWIYYEIVFSHKIKLFLMYFLIILPILNHFVLFLYYYLEKCLIVSKVKDSLNIYVVIKSRVMFETSK